MNINKRLSSLEKGLGKSKEVVIRFAGGDGDYPERNEDIKENRNVIIIMAPGYSCEDIRRWAQ